jgi:predicted neuraminidase
MIHNIVRSLLLSAIVSSATLAEGPQGTLIFPLQDIHNHSSSIVQCPNGDLLVCWYHGSGERWADDVQVQGARSHDGGKTWSEVFTMADTPDLPDCNPVLFIDANERLWLFWAQIIANRWEHCLLKYVRADEYTADGPPNWNWQDVIVLKPGDTLPEQIKSGLASLGFDQGLWGEYAHPYDKMLVEAAGDPFKRQKGWMPRNHVTVLPSGRILLPLYSDGFNLSLTAISDDLGDTWQASGAMVGLGPIQPSIARRDSGQLVAYFRDGGGPPQRVQTSTSDDEGTTWSPAIDTDVPNPSGSMEVIRLADGDWIMVNNDTEDSRSSLAVSLSTDEGKTWATSRHLEHYVNGSYAYPSIIQTADGKIHATYTYTKKDKVEAGESIKHVSFNKSWLTKE